LSSSYCLLRALITLDVIAARWLCKFYCVSVDDGMVISRLLVVIYNRTENRIGLRSACVFRKIMRQLCNFTIYVLAIADVTVGVLVVFSLALCE